MKASWNVKFVGLKDTKTSNARDNGDLNCITTITSLVRSNLRKILIKLHFGNLASISHKKPQIRYKVLMKKPVYSLIIPIN